MKYFLARLFLNFFYIIQACILFLLVPFFYLLKPSRKKIIFGTTPIVNNKYWANALKEIKDEIQLEAETLMETYYARINKREDFDLYFEDLFPKPFRNKYIVKLFSPLVVWLYIMKNAKIFVLSFNGVVFRNFLYFIEPILFKLNGIKTILIPYGSDAYMYSQIRNKSLQNALLIDYPHSAKLENKIRKKVFYWSRYADIVIAAGMCFDGFPRWDLTTHQIVQIDTAQWVPKKNYNKNDGYNGVVKIIHTPNHRGSKGTEFIIKAIEDLKREGLKVELILLEGVQNNVVREKMQEADILCEQLIFTGYGLSGIEGMASGLPVIANLEDSEFRKLFRRYSFLNECPIFSTTPENIKENLRVLVTNPKLREELGKLGRKYVEKYHSYKTTQYIFRNIIKKLKGEKVDLINLFHPLKSEYVKTDYIEIPEYLKKERK